MNTLEIKKTAVLAAFRQGGSETKELLRVLFGKDTFLDKVIDRVKTFEDACAETGEDPNDPHWMLGSKDEVAYKKLKVIVRALNEGWTPNWNNNSYKWYPWFYMNSPGFRFDASYYVPGTYSTGGSRLCFSSEELSYYAANQFIDLYKDLLTTDNEKTTDLEF